MSKFDQAKLLLQMRKVQKELGKMSVVVEKGDGAVQVEMNGEQKVKRVSLDSEKIDVNDLGQVERWLEDAFREAITQSQQAAAEKMKPFMGALGSLGL